KISYVEEALRYIENNYLNIYCERVIILNIPERLFHIGDYFLSTRTMFSQKLAGQQIEIFVKDTVHHQIPVFREVISFKHFFMTEPYPVIFAIMKVRSVQKRSSL